MSLGLFLSSSAIIPPTSSFAYYDVVTESRWGYGADGWYFTLEEMKEIYEKEYEEGERLEHYIKLEDGKYIASYDGQTFEVPEKFVKTTLNHLEQMLEKGYAKYIFRLDAFHHHLFIPEEVFDEYGDISGAELIAESIKDDRLGALYHNTEHLALRNPPKTGEIDPEAKDLISKRSVLGWYDGRPLEIIHPKDSAPEKIKEANTANTPDDCHDTGGLTFKAIKNGEFVIKHNGKEIRVDLSFDANYYY